MKGENGPCSTAYDIPPEPLSRFSGKGRAGKKVKGEDVPTDRAHNIHPFPPSRFLGEGMKMPH